MVLPITATARDVFAAADGAAAAISGLTAKHIFALMAYEHLPDVRAQFDKRFGAGAADRVISQVSAPQPVVAAPFTPDIHVAAPSVTVQLPEQIAPQVIIQALDEGRLALLEQRVADLSKPRTIRVTERDINGNIAALEQRAETS